MITGLSVNKAYDRKRRDTIRLNGSKIFPAADRITSGTELMKKIWLFFRKLFDQETSCRKWSIFTVSATAFFVLGAPLLVFIVDPFYRYHEPFFYDMVYYELYATAPRILKHQQYDLLMLGTSMTRNFFLSDIDKAFGCKSVKLAASGGSVIDLCKFFDIARKAKGAKLKRTVLSLDIYPINKSKPNYKQFDYMYREDHREDYRYLFSRQTFSGMHYLVKRKLNPKRQRKHQSDRNRMFSTEYEGKKYGFKEVMKDALHNAATHHTQTPFSPAAHKENFYGKLLPVFDNNPQISFTVYLPPYHIYTYCQSEQFKEADALIRQRTEIMLELLKRPNVTLHDFQADRKFVLNHDYFSDVQHFSNIAAVELLKDLNSGRRRISTPEQVRENEKELRTLIKETMPEYFRNLKQFRGK